MPSGDAFQSAVYAVFLRYLGVHPIGVLLFHIAICISRVYYMCHWVADTIVASMIGTLVAKLLLTVNAQEVTDYIKDTLL